MEAADFWLGVAWKAFSILGLIVSAIIAILLLKLKSEFATKSELAAIAKESGETRSKVTVIETVLGQMPNKDSMHELALTIERLRGDLKAVAAQLDGMGGTLKRIDVTLDRHEDILSAAARES